jgi:hypothetical protein
LPATLDTGYAEKDRRTEFFLLAEWMERGQSAALGQRIVQGGRPLKRKAYSNYDKKDVDYELPPELIAQPMEPPDSYRLMVWEGRTAN